MPDSEHAIPSDGGYRDRTGDLLLAKAQNTVHQGARGGGEPAALGAAAAAAATRPRTAPESLRETHAAWCWVCSEDDPEGQHHEQDCVICGDEYCTGRRFDDGVCPTCTEAWDKAEQRARALDRSDATHALRVRHHQAAGAQRHVRTAVERIAPNRRRRILASGYPKALSILAHPGWHAGTLSAIARRDYASGKALRDRARWDALERHARALDRSAATHALRVRHHQAAGAQRHVRTAVGW